MPKTHSTKPVRSVAARQARRLPPARATSVSRNREWLRRLKELAAFKKEHGHCSVSTLDKRHAGLGEWVRTQRSRRSLGQMSEERIRALDELGFPWNVPSVRERMAEERWQAMYEALAAYRQTHGHCSVPSRGSSRLSQWVGRQRVAKRAGNLAAERVRRLDELAFPWDAQDQLVQLEQATWESMYNALAAYRRTHGHCEVPSEESVRLSRWVRLQRVAKQLGSLSAERIRRLEKLPFVWDTLEEQWERMFAALVDYKTAHGNCKVPANGHPNSKLAAWVKRKKPATPRERCRQIGENGWRRWESGFPQQNCSHGQEEIPAEFPAKTRAGAG